MQRKLEVLPSVAMLPEWEEGIDCEPDLIILIASVLLIFPTVIIPPDRVASVKAIQLLRVCINHPIRRLLRQPFFYPTLAGGAVMIMAESRQCVEIRLMLGFPPNQKSG